MDGSLTFPDEMILDASPNMVSSDSRAESLSHHTRGIIMSTHLQKFKSLPALKTWAADNKFAVHLDSESSHGAVSQPHCLAYIATTWREVAEPCDIMRNYSAFHLILRSVTDASTTFSRVGIVRNISGWYLPRIPSRDDFRTATLV